MHITHGNLIYIYLYMTVIVGWIFGLLRFFLLCMCTALIATNQTLTAIVMQYDQAEVVHYPSEYRASWPITLLDMMPWGLH